MTDNPPFLAVVLRDTSDENYPFAVYAVPADDPREASERAVFVGAHTSEASAVDVAAALNRARIDWRPQDAVE